MTSIILTIYEKFKKKLLAIFELVFQKTILGIPVIATNALDRKNVARLTAFATENVDEIFEFQISNSNISKEHFK